MKHVIPEKPIYEVRGLLKVLKQTQAEINAIQKKCKHPVIEHKQFPDINCGEGHSSRCLECGKQLGCSTMTPFGNVIKKRWIERVKA